MNLVRKKKKSSYKRPSIGLPEGVMERLMASDKESGAYDKLAKSKLFGGDDNEKGK